MATLGNPTNTIEVLQKYNFNFQKKFGQNFLIDSNILEHIVDAADVTEDDCVLEIGPGIGTMTQYLCERAREVVAVEIDKNLIPILADTLSSYQNVTVINEDILKVDINKIAQEKNQGRPIKVVANLPYYITTPIIMALFEQHVPLANVTVMVQKEVAQRICAPAGKGDYGAFSVFCQYYAEPELLFDVPPSCFIPQPKVTSSVLKLTMRAAPPCEIPDEKLFFRVVKASFAQRRKTLLNALSSGLSQFDKPALAAVIEDCGFAPTVRGETLDIPGFAAVCRELLKL